jgi:hypothetical protein
MVSMMMMCGQLFSCPEDARWKLNYYGEEGSVRGERYVLIAGKSEGHYQSIFRFLIALFWNCVYLRSHICYDSTLRC